MQPQAAWASNTVALSGAPGNGTGLRPIWPLHRFQFSAFVPPRRADDPPMLGTRQVWERRQEDDLCFEFLTEQQKPFVAMVVQNLEVVVPIDEVLIALALLIDVRGQSCVFDRMPTLQELWMRNQDRAQWLISPPPPG